MARNDPYLPNHKSPTAGNNVTFDGSDAATNSAIISGLYGNFDAEIHVEDSDDSGATWTRISRLKDEDGVTTFRANWSTTFNRLMVSQNQRRVRIDNVDTVQGNVSVDGDER